MSSEEAKVAEELARQPWRKTGQLTLRRLGLKTLPSLPTEAMGLRSLDVSSNRLQELPEWVWDLEQLERQPDKGLADFSPLRIQASTRAVLYALDAKTGKELYNSGDEIVSFVHFGALSVANGRVYLGSFDSTLYCFGLPGH